MSSAAAAGAAAIGVVLQPVGDTKEASSSSASASGTSRRHRHREKVSTVLQMRMLKTKMCRWAQQGKCERGDTCFFAHSEAELRRCPDLSMTRMCAKFEQTGSCTNGASCKFAHCEADLRGTIEFYRTALCEDWKKGTCKLAGLCRFAHGPEQLHHKPPLNEIESRTRAEAKAQQRDESSPDLTPQSSPATTHSSSASAEEEEEEDHRRRRLYDFTDQPKQQAAQPKTNARASCCSSSQTSTHEPCEDENQSCYFGDDETLPAPPTEVNRWTHEFLNELVLALSPDDVQTLLKMVAQIISAPNNNNCHADDEQHQQEEEVL